MTNRFMVSVAALALIAGTGLANAQGTKSESGGSSMQHSSPADTSAGSAKSESSEKGSMKSSQSGQNSPGAMKNDRAEDSVKGGSTSQRAEDRGKSSTTNQRAEDNAKSGNTKAEGRDRDQNMKAEGRDRDRDSNMKAEGRDRNHDGNMKAEGRDRNHDGNMKAEGRDRDRDNNMKAEGRDRTGTSAAEGRSTTERSQTTTGQAGAAAKLSTEQRTKITTVIRNEHISPVTNVNFSVAVGTRVPREGITLHRLPSEVVTIYPEWRGYEYILVRDEIVVIDPATYEIVAVLNV
jgi:uncharacterized protein DUF1236